MSKKRIAALAGAILLVMMYLLTVVFALLDHPLKDSLLSASLFCTVVVPPVLYGYFIFLRATGPKKGGGAKDRRPEDADRQD